MCVIKNEFVSILENSPAGRFNFAYDYWSQSLKRDKVIFFGNIDERINDHSYSNEYWYAALTVIKEAKEQLKTETESFENKTECLHTFFMNSSRCLHKAHEVIMDYLKYKD